MKTFSPKTDPASGLDIPVLIFIGVVIVATSLMLLPFSPQISQTLLIGGISLLAIYAAVWGS